MCYLLSALYLPAIYCLIVQYRLDAVTIAVASVPASVHCVYQNFQLVSEQAP
jgi:uncharacterized membrane protein